MIEADLGDSRGEEIATGPARAATNLHRFRRQLCDEGLHPRGLRVHLKEEESKTRVCLDRALPSPVKIVDVPSVSQVNTTKNTNFAGSIFPRPTGSEYLSITGEEPLRCRKYLEAGWKYL